MKWGRGGGGKRGVLDLGSNEGYRRSKKKKSSKKRGGNQGTKVEKHEAKKKTG